jgi:hypothetical protein
MSSKVYYVNEIVTAKNIEKLNQHFSHSDYEYDYVVILRIVDFENKNFKINIPLGVKSVICFSMLFLEYEPSHFFKIPFGTRFININKNSQIDKVYGYKCLYIKLTDIIEKYKPSKFKFVNSNEKQRNTKKINEDYFLVAPIIIAF